MKFRKIIFSLCLGTLLLAGCTKDFEKININPTNVTDLQSNALFTNVILGVSGGEYEAWRTNFIYNTQFVQQFASIAWPQGDTYMFDEGYNSSLWDSYYGGPIKNVINLIEKTTGVATEVNYNSAARILKAFAFLRLTDSYGDIPYTDAGKGYIKGTFAPAYDEQKAILTDIINELDAAAKAFDASKPFKGDITSYNGDVAMWKKAAYSLMLRTAMRMSKKDVAAAQAGVTKAVAGGVFTDYTESFRVKHIAGNYDNPNSHVLGYYNGARGQLASEAFKFSKFFIDLLKSNNDPRVSILSVVRTGTNEDGNPLIQKGLLSGTDPNGFSGLSSYSQLRADFTDADDPNILVSYGQTLLLMAEARERGWITTSTSEAYFREGIKSSINQLKLYSPAAGVINDAVVNVFAASVIYPAASADRMAAINTQYYIASLIDGYESHANWLRSGYPVLTPVNFPGNYTGGKIPLRFQYPASESGLNGTNLSAAISRQGANNWNTNIWWSKP